MSTDSRENHVDYVEFPAPSAQAFASVKEFYKEVFGWSFQEWGEGYADTRDSGIASGFGAAGSIAVIFLWVYYSAQIFLLGAEFTWVYAKTFGSMRSLQSSERAAAQPALAGRESHIAA